MYNSILQLIGQKKDIPVSKAIALAIQTILEDKTKDGEFVINIKGMTFRKSSVRFVEIHNDGNAKVNSDEDMRKFYDEEKLNRIKYLSWTKEKLGSYTDIFEGLYKISSGVEAPLEVIQKAKEVQTKFFKENSMRTLCDLYLLKPLILMNAGHIDVWESGFFRVAEKAVYRDMELSGQLKSAYQIKDLKKSKENETVEQMKDRADVNRHIDKEFNDVVQSALDNF